MRGNKNNAHNLSELRKDLLNSYNAKQQQVRSPPPKRRTPAQVAQTRMVWKLRLQQSERENKYVPSAPQTTGSSPSARGSSNNYITPSYAQQPMRPNMASSTKSNEGSTYSAQTPKSPSFVGFDDIYAQRSPKFTSPESNSGNTIDSQAKEGQNFFSRRISQVDTLAAVDHEQAVKVSLEVADSISEAQGAHNFIQQQGTSELLDDYYLSHDMDSVFNKDLQALPPSDEVYSEIINMLHVAMPDGYARPNDAIVRAVAKRDATIRFINHNYGQPTMNCWVDCADLTNHNSVSQLNVRGGHFKKQNGKRALLFSSGKISFPQNWNGIMSFVLCKLAPGRQIFLDEEDEIASTELSSNKYFSDGIDFEVKKENPKLFDSYSIHKKNNVLHLLESPKQVLACWHVTFVPKRKGALSPQAMRNRSPTKVDDDDDNAHSRVAEWQRRVNQRDMNLRSPRLHHSSSSPTHRGKHHYEMSKNAPEERKSATLAYHRLEVEIDFIRKGLQQNLSDLHDRVNRIHENYIRVEDEITKNLEHSLKDLLYTRADRRYKLHAWKLQLKEYLCHANLIDRLHSTAGRELQYEQKKAFDSIFEDIAKNDFLPRIPKYNMNVDPAQQMCTPIQVDVTQRIYSGPLQKEFYSPTKYNEHVGHEGEEDNDSQYYDESTTMTEATTESRLPPAYALNHILRMRQKTEDPYKRESRLDALQARTQSKRAVRPKVSPSKGASPPSSRFTWVKDSSSKDDDNTHLVDAVELSGSMLKGTKTKNGTGWKRRFFILSGNKLKWKENHDNNHVLGSISLEKYNVEIDKDHPTDFFLLAPKRKIILRAFRDHGGPASTTNVTRQQWIDCLTANIHASRQALRKKRGLLASFQDFEGLEQLDNVLRESTYSIACILNENLKDPKEVNGVAKALHRVFCAHGDVEHAKMVVEMVQSSKNPNIQGIFESKNKERSLAATMLAMYINNILKDTVFKFLFPVINIVQTRPQSYNFMVGTGSTSGEKIRNFQQLCLSFFRSIDMICQHSTPGLQYVMITLSLKLKNLLGTNTRRSNAIVFGFIVKESICAALSNAKELFSKSIIGKMSNMALKVLRNVSETLEKLVDGLLFDSQSFYLNLVPLNTFLQNNFNQVENFTFTLQELYKKNAKTFLSVGQSSLADKTHSFSEDDTELLASGLHLMQKYAYRKGKSYWANLTIDKDLKLKMPRLQINKFIEVIFDMLGKPNSGNVRKNYGSSGIK